MSDKKNAKIRAEVKKKEFVDVEWFSEPSMTMTVSFDKEKPKNAYKLFTEVNKDNSKDSE